MCRIQRHLHNSESRRSSEGTGRILLGRIGIPDETVGAAVYLASDESSYVAEALLMADGD